VFRLDLLSQIFAEPRLPFAQATPQRGNEFADSDVKIRIDAATVDVQPRKREPGTGGKTLHRAIVPAQNYLRRQRIIREPGYGRDFSARKPAKRIA
jgi:hypothetical protein